MKLNKSINIDLKQFILKGKFDYIKIAQKKEWILNNFDKPDFKWDNERESSIWKYGSLEFHFDKDELFLIWCDDLSNLETCKKINYNKWFLNERNDFKLSYVLDILNCEAANYIVKHNTELNNAEVKIIESNVKLYFEKEENENSENPNPNPNEYLLIAFGLSDS